MIDTYAGILKMNEHFYDDGTEISIKYQSNKMKKELCDVYNIDKIAGENGDFEKAENLLVWLSENTYHKGDYDNRVEPNAIKLLEYSFKNPSHGINCRALSEILSQCLSVLGMKSRVVTIIPCSPYDLDCHVICEVYIGEFNKWVMLDPTFGAYATGKDNLPLNVLEIRERIANREDISFFEKAHYNNEKFDEAATLEYYAKDMFMLELNEFQGGCAEISRKILIAPQGFDYEKRRKVNFDLIKKNMRGVDWALKFIEQKAKIPIVRKGSDILR